MPFPIPATPALSDEPGAEAAVAVPLTPIFAGADAGDALPFRVDRRSNLLDLVQRLRLGWNFHSSEDCEPFVSEFSGDVPDGKESGSFSQRNWGPVWEPSSGSPGLGTIIRVPSLNATGNHHQGPVSQRNWEPPSGPRLSTQLGTTIRAPSLNATGNHHQGPVS
ncbi:hypothetical protein SDJN03_12512, partial [Cucurbita argyrosperma subsp. sororia]